MSANSQHEAALPSPESDVKFRAAEELAEWAGVDRAAEGWQALKVLLGPLTEERPLTWQHSQRVGTYALGIAAIEDWSDRRLVVYGALAHDVGKLAVPKDIAEAAEGFEDHNRDIKRAAIKPHARKGFEMVLRTGFPFTAPVAGRHHLYQKDSYGVPLNEVPLTLTNTDKAYLEDTTRLVALADHFDAMTTRDNNLSTAERRTALIEDFPLSQDLVRIDWLEANQIA